MSTFRQQIVINEINDLIVICNYCKMEKNNINNNYKLDSKQLKYYVNEDIDN